MGCTPSFGTRQQDPIMVEFNKSFERVLQSYPERVRKSRLQAINEEEMREPKDDAERYVFEHIQEEYELARAELYTVEETLDKGRLMRLVRFQGHPLCCKMSYEARLRDQQQNTKKLYVLELTTLTWSLPFSGITVKQLKH
jgi:hypothetical protein